MSSSISSLLNITVNRNQSDTVPAHHVIAKAAELWLPYLTNWNYGQSVTQPQKIGSRSSSRERNNDGGTSKVKRTGFKNPWPSWHKPTRMEVWDALEWGEDPDPCIQLAASHAPNSDDSLHSIQTGNLRRSKSSKETRSRAQLAALLLRVQEPDFSFDPKSQQSKTTWLGHAGMLVQLPPLHEEGRPIRCIFDPIFSNRSSPTQMAGPLRSYPPPCKVESLPPIDVFMMSHNHHDHLDHDTVMSVWKLNKDWIRFVVPLGNKAWFVECGIDKERITELDWWESVNLSQITSQPLKITCTPCQHNSGRTGSDADVTLWSSWYLEHPQPEPYKIYFAGDTGYQFHASPEWPPEPSFVDGEIDTRKRDYTERNPAPSCPAFQEIADRLGSPDLLLLPIAVGATYSYLRSYIPVPDSLSPIPRHRPGVTGANHMPPWDAVHVFQLMTTKSDRQKQRPPIAIGMHWGTFVPERTEVLKTLGQLEYACKQSDLQFGRSLDEIKDKSTQSIFLALNHGQSVIV